MYIKKIITFVDFPHPLCPTKATVSPGFAVQFKPFKIGLLRRVGYEK